MPLQSPPRKVSETEHMLRLLMCVDALESVTSTQLWTFAAEQELMDYVTMRLCLHKLLAAGELETGEGALKDQLLLTDRGREALALFGDRLPQDVRERIGKAAPGFRSRVSRNRQVHAVYEMARLNDFRLNLSVQEGDLPTIYLRMETNNRALASKSLHRFEAHAAAITTYLYQLAEQAVQQGTTEQAVPLAPDAVLEHSAAEFTAHVPLSGRRARYIVELLLPSRTAAEAFVRMVSMPQEAAKIATRITELLGSSIRTARGKSSQV